MNTRLIAHLSISILLITSTSDARSDSSTAFELNTITFVEQQLEINVEIAANRTQREQGLMHRTSLGENQGMLFRYPDLAPRGVWMKNTLLPLDALFLADTGHIVSMLRNLQPCPKPPCTIYDSQTPAMYMLEVSAGFIDSNHLKIGQQIRLPWPAKH
jgi:uncharacterized membrane protein (UPF0127 family)